MLFAAKVTLKGKTKSLTDTNDKIIIGQDENGHDITETFYRVVEVISFNQSYSDQSIQEVGKGCCLNLISGGTTTVVCVNVPLAALEALTEACNKYGHPLQGKIIDLRPENQEQITQDYQNKTGLFSYLKAPIQ